MATSLVFTTIEELGEKIRKKSPYVCVSNIDGYTGVFLGSLLYSEKRHSFENREELIRIVDDETREEFLSTLFSIDFDSTQRFLTRKNDDVFSKQFFPAYGRVVHLPTGTWSERTPDHIFTREFSGDKPTSFDFKNFRDSWIKVTKSEENYLYLQRLCGYLISGERPNGVDIIYDPNSCFKHSILERLRNILGNYCIKSQYESFEGFYNVRLAFSRSNKIPTSPLHQMISDRKLSTRNPYPIGFQNMAKSLFVVDSEPEIDFAEDLTGKIRYLELPHLKPEDIILASDITLTDEHFLEWCIEGAKAYYASGLCEPENVKESTHALLERIDSVYRFCQKEIIPVPVTVGCESIKDLHKAYQDRGYDEIPISRNQFARKVSGMFARHVDGTVYGINLV
jgi:hypothetical protein